MLHFPTHDHKHVQAALKFQSPYFDWATYPIILQFFPQKHTYKVIFLRHLGTLLLFTHTAISIHEHNHITAQTPQVYTLARTYLMSSLSFLFSLPLFLPLSLTIIISGRKQPCILHLLLNFHDEAAALFLSSLSPSSTSGHLRSFSFVPHASSDVQPCLSSWLFQR